MQKNKKKVERPEWRAVVGYEGRYEVSSSGKVRSLLFKRKKELKLSKNPKGYFTVTLCAENKKYLTKTAHRLVAEAFIPNPENKKEVNHIDEIKTNNSVYNLEWSTRQENALHSFKGEKSPVSKLVDRQVEEIKDLFATGKYTKTELSNKFGVGWTQIDRIINGKRTGTKKKNS